MWNLKWHVGSNRLYFGAWPYFADALKLVIKSVSFAEILQALHVFWVHFICSATVTLNVLRVAAWTLYYFNAKLIYKHLCFHLLVEWSIFRLPVRCLIVYSAHPKLIVATFLFNHHTGTVVIHHHQSSFANVTDVCRLVCAIHYSTYCMGSNIKHSGIQSSLNRVCFHAQPLNATNIQLSKSFTLYLWCLVKRSYMKLRHKWITHWYYGGKSEHWCAYFARYPHRWQGHWMQLRSAQVQNNGIAML